MVTDVPYWHLQLIFHFQQTERKRETECQQHQWERVRKLNMARLQYRIEWSQPTASGSLRARSGPVDVWNCFVCNQVWHVASHCPKRRRPSPPGNATSASPAVLFVVEEVRDHVDNPGHNVTVGLYYTVQDQRLLLVCS